MKFLPSPSPQELAAEAREARRRRPPRTAHEHFVWLVRKGFINSKWEVTRLIGGDAEPEPDYKNFTGEKPSASNGKSTKKKPKA